MKVCLESVNIIVVVFWAEDRCGFSVVCVEKRNIYDFLWFTSKLFVCRKEVFLQICPGNKRDKPTLEKIIIDRVNWLLISLYVNKILG